MDIPEDELVPLIVDIFDLDEKYASLASCANFRLTGTGCEEEMRAWSLVDVAQSLNPGIDLSFINNLSVGSWNLGKICSSGDCCNNVTTAAPTTAAPTTAP